MLVVDTSGVLAAKDADHPQHAAVGELLSDATDELLLSPLVLAECDYMLGSRLGDAAAREFLGEVADGAFQLVDFDPGDLATANGVIDRYHDLAMGAADASLVVIAARYETTRVLTFDQRHFRAIAPLWGAASFTLLPSDDKHAT